MSYYVAVHGGAGFHSVESEQRVRKALRRACTRALKHLQSGASACIAVEESISELEDSECLNAGYGSNLTSKGTVECDAAVMDGAGNFGSVGAVPGVKNPIRVARAILDHARVKSPIGRVSPLTLVSTGAHDFACSSQIKTVDPITMISPRAHNEWELWTERVGSDVPPPSGPSRHQGGSNIIQDTVGSISLDSSGEFAAGVSSGGILLKLPGRVGEAAIFGAGCWAQRAEENTSVVCCASGTGEAIIRASLARHLSDALSRSPDDPHEEIRRILMNDFYEGDIQHQNPSVGVIVLTNDHRENGASLPRLWCAFNTPSMAIAYASSHDPSPKSMILRQKFSDGIDDRKNIYLTVLPWTTN